MSEKDFMSIAIAKTREGIALGNSPFGATVVKDGVVVASAPKKVWPDTDPTAHAEVNAIRNAARALATIDLSGCVMYTTCEPCPMCLSAIHWAKFDRVVYGATIADAAGSGFNELRVEAKKLAEMGGSKLVVEKIASEESARECAALFREWKQAAKCGVY
jgi:tRNA(Arg) A34 adenosine deaminase TadA